MDFVRDGLQIAKFGLLLQNLAYVLRKFVLFLLEFVDKWLMAVKLILNFAAVLFEKLNYSLHIIGLRDTWTHILSIGF